MQRDFQDVLTDLDEGKVHRQLTEMLPELVKAVVESRKAGFINLKITVRPENRQVFLKADVTSKIPRATTESTLFFPDEEGDLHRSDPKQQTLRDVPLRPNNLRNLKEEG